MSKQDTLPPQPSTQRPWHKRKRTWVALSLPVLTVGWLVFKSYTYWGIIAGRTIAAGEDLFQTQLRPLTLVALSGVSLYLVKTFIFGGDVTFSLAGLWGWLKTR